MVEEIITDIKDVLNFAERLGVILNKDSSQLLLKNSDWKIILEELSSEGNFIITPALLEKKICRTKLSCIVKRLRLRGLLLLLKLGIEHLILG